MGHTALVEDDAQRGAQLGPRGVEAEHTQRDVCLDRGAEVGRRVVVEAPGAVLALGPEQVPDGALADVVMRQAQEAEQQHVLGGHGDVGLELTRPPAHRVLTIEEVIGRRAHGSVGAGGGGRLWAVEQCVSHGRPRGGARQHGRSPPGCGRRRDRCGPPTPWWPASRSPSTRRR